MWTSIVQFFQSLFSKPATSNQESVATLAKWANEHGFVHQAQAKGQLHQEYDHLTFFQHGEGHQTLARMSQQKPDDSTVIADCVVTFDGVSTPVYCYIFENTGVSLPQMHLVNRAASLFAVMRGSSLSPISLPSILSSSHSALCDQAQWGDRVLKSKEIKTILSEMNPESILWLETDDCHALLVTTAYTSAPVEMGRLLFRHFAAFRYKKSGRS